MAPPVSVAGSQFVKKYYKMCSDEPENLHRFYQVRGRGEGSDVRRAPVLPSPTGKVVDGSWIGAVDRKGPRHNAGSEQSREISVEIRTCRRSAHRLDPQDIYLHL